MRNRLVRPTTGWTGPTSNLTHRWPLDDDNISGSTALDVVGSLNGTINGGITSTAGPQGTDTARACDGQPGSYISFASSPIASFIGGAYSIGFWAKLTDITAAGSSGFRATYAFFTVTTVTDEMRILNDTSVAPGTPGFSWVSDETVTSSPQTSSGTWAHIVFTNDIGGAGAKIYMNGVLVSSGSGGGALGATGQNQIFGLDNTNASPDGAIKQFVTYSAALSSGDVTQLYNAF